VIANGNAITAWHPVERAAIVRAPARKDKADMRHLRLIARNAARHPDAFMPDDPFGLTTNWTFVATRASRHYRRDRIKDVRRELHRAPAFRIIKAADFSPEWTIYFLYLADGQLTPAHRFTLGQLRTMARKLLLVCAAPTPDHLPAGLDELADALIWKGLSGYDFSAYAVGLRHIAARSAGANVLVLNDSVLGPFGDLEPLLARARWDLTGFTASSIYENHIQSYAFVMRGVTRRRLWSLWSVFLPGLAFDHFNAVVRCQETRFARVASRHMSVGALWYAGNVERPDPALFGAAHLLELGFPFIKRSAIGKYRHMLDPEIVTQLERKLLSCGHPTGS
jgi:hypothetical protein